MIGHPMDTKFKYIVSKTILINCSVKVKYITNTLSIFGPDLEGLQGKPGITELDHVETGVV